MNIVEEWGQVIRNCVTRKTRGATKETREDYEQECFIKILEKMETIEAIKSGQGHTEATRFVYKIVNELITNLKKYDRLREHEPLSEHIEESEPLISETNRLAIEAAIESLSVTEQFVIRNSFYLGRHHKDIAQSVGKSEVWVKKVKAKAINNLRNYLS